MNTKTRFLVPMVLTLALSNLMLSNSSASTIPTDNMVLTAKDVTKESKYRITRTAYGSAGEILYERTTNPPDGSLVEFKVMEKKNAVDQGLLFLDYAGSEPTAAEQDRLGEEIRKKAKHIDVERERKIIQEMAVYDPEYNTTSGSFSTGGNLATAQYTIYWGDAQDFEYIINYVKYSLDSQPLNPIYFNSMLLEGMGRSFTDNGLCPRSPVSPNYQTYNLSWLGYHGSVFRMILHSRSDCAHFLGTKYSGYVTM